MTMVRVGAEADIAHHQETGQLGFDKLDGLDHRVVLAVCERAVGILRPVNKPKQQVMAVACLPPAKASFGCVNAVKGHVLTFLSSSTTPNNSTDANPLATSGLRKAISLLQPIRSGEGHEEEEAQQDVEWCRTLLGKALNLFHSLIILATAAMLGKIAQLFVPKLRTRQRQGRAAERVE